MPSTKSTPSSNGNPPTDEVGPGERPSGRDWPFTCGRIALDPGHLGGAWARREGRAFGRPPVCEGDLTLLVAYRLRALLEADGLDVFLTREDSRPRADATPAGEIAARAERLRAYRPDLTLCLHLNAFHPPHPTADNRLLIYIHGNPTPAERRDPIQRRALRAKRREGSRRLEQAVAESIADAFTAATGLPPIPPEHAGHAVRVGSNPCVFARNLLANRLYPGPVVYLEPYYQNNPIVRRRLLLGDYAGERTIAGRRYRSIIREYADAVLAGLRPFIART